ncbi:hypothetical protein ACFW4O_00915 [Streptomyces mutabilis]|nr:MULTISPECIES: hypothetical protein [unclassified Streptomyces]MDN3246024.1 hypothetical protein [Streptomyces sp. ZSW22]MDN3254282.1 hypothetical protein [Streptomyces sp. MA25(2023)]MDQ0383506.1 threonine dehydrogenase-like Zn-dependent dehydrogenase [Streptomyces sp. DSM 42143]
MLLDRLAAGEIETAQLAAHTRSLDEAPTAYDVFQGEGRRLRMRRQPPQS